MDSQQQNIPIYYQMSTSNTSFLEMHYYLKSIGIHNNKFFLRLLDPDLAGVDPFDPNLTQMMKIKILREVQRNYWYFLREVVRVPVTGNSRGAKYRLHRGNLAMSFCLLYNFNVFMELPRQLGKSISAVIFYLYCYNFATSMAEIVFLNKQSRDSKLNLQRLKEIRELLPSYLQMAQEYSVVGQKKKKIPSTVLEIQHPINKNSIKTSSSARNEMAATNLLRGRTITMLWGDEWAFTPYNELIYVNTVPALHTAFENAKKAGVPYGILLTTTPGVLTTKEGLYAYKMKEDSTKFNELWYDMTLQQLNNIIQSNKYSNYVYIRYEYDQIVLKNSAEWFESQCKEMQWDWDKIRREILLEWSDSPENSPFAKEDLETIGQLVRKPIEEFYVFNRFKLNIYEKIPLNRFGVPKIVPIMGVDVSGGYNRDSSAITIIDSKTTRVLADFKDNSISIPDFSRLIIYITQNMVPNAVINVERNGGFGASVIAKLKETGIKENLYFEIKDKIIEETNDAHGGIHKKKRRTKVYGLDSGKTIRETLIDILRQRVDLHKDKFISPVIYKELQGMQVKKNGKVEHSDNSHDDQVFSYLMALYVWYEGKDLKENYNINKSSIKTDMDIDDNVTDLDRRWVNIVDEVSYVDETENEKELTKQLKEFDQKVIFADKFFKDQEKFEENQLREMLRNKEIKKAYLEYINDNVPNQEDFKGYKIPAKQTSEDLDVELLEGQTQIPDYIFNNFNEDPDELEQIRRKENFNFGQFNNLR